MKLLIAFAFFALSFACLHGRAAATICTQPNALTNGAYVDANGLNTNFQALVTCGNAIDNTNIGSLGLYLSQMKPTTVAQATFGGTTPPVFPLGEALNGPVIPGAAPTPTAGASMVFFGDSITYGYGTTAGACNVSPPTGTCFADLVSNAYGMTEVNLGLPSSTLEHASYGGAPASGIDRYSSALIPYCTAANYLTLLYGINDVTTSYNNSPVNSPVMSPANYAANVDTIIAACNAAGMPYAHMRLIGLTYVSQLGTSIGVQPSGYVAREQTFTAALAAEAQKRGTLYAATYATMIQGGPGILASDGLHPNDSGHAILAGAVEGATYVQSTAESSASASLGSALGGGTGVAVVGGMQLSGNGLTAQLTQNLGLFAGGSGGSYVSANFGSGGTGGFVVGDGTTDGFYARMLPASIAVNGANLNYSLSSGSGATYVSANYGTGGTGGFVVGNGAGGYARIQYQCVNVNASGTGFPVVQVSSGGPTGVVNCGGLTNPSWDFDTNGHIYFNSGGSSTTWTLKV